MRVLLTTYGARWDVEPMMGLAVQLGALRAATPPSAADLPPHAAELVAAQFDTVAAAAEECVARFATGVMPTGGWR